MKNKDFTTSLYDFMADTEGLTKEDIISELEVSGVDAKSLGKKISKLVNRCSEDRRLAWRINAKQKRAEIEDLFKSNKVTPSFTNLKQKMLDILSGGYGIEASSYAEAYFRKKGELSEDDIASLIKDLENLNLLEENGNKKE
ncbi:MAG: hypothetical protein WAZ30_12905 [Syntrophorhabdus sp.]|jgi:hypothetical protein